MKATIGAQGIDVASMASTRAIVPHEQSGVATLITTAPTTDARWWRDSQARTRAGSTWTLRIAATSTEKARYGQGWAMVTPTSATVLATSLERHRLPQQHAVRSRTSSVTMSRLTE